MQPKCPYCGGELSGDDVLVPPMSRRRRRIYDIVTEAGYKGIPTQTLLTRMYEPGHQQTPGGYVVLRVQIHEINRMLSSIGQRIIARPHGVYRLVSIGEGNGKTAEEATAQGDHGSN